MTQQPDAVHSAVRELFLRGDELAQRGDFDAAKRLYNEALTLLGKDWRLSEAAARAFAALGEVELAAGNREAAFDCFSQAVQYPGGWGNPFIHLRLGQLRLEQGDEESAVIELTRAYKTGGIAVFMQDDPRYLELLRARSIV